MGFLQPQILHFVSQCLLAITQQLLDRIPTWTKSVRRVITVQLARPVEKPICALRGPSVVSKAQLLFQTVVYAQLVTTALIRPWIPLPARSATTALLV
jgi:hypothetical protein